ncbi:TolC family protein (plasmid) [Asticcacaulis sp. AND118]|nr:TolC family protein [Asticcacaulis sp. AND118]
MIFASLGACKTMESARLQPTPVPKAELPAAWRTAGAAADATPRAQRPAWWLQLNDPVLDQLMTLAQAQNLDVEAAGHRIREAQALQGLTAAQRKPQVGIQANGGIAAGQGYEGGYDDAIGRASVGLGGSLEFDPYNIRGLEGRYAETGLWLAQAQRRQVMNALMSEVARVYIDLRTRQQLKALLQKNLELQTETQRIIEIQTRAGDGVQLDVLRAKAQVENTRSEFPNLAASIRLAGNRLAVLTGQTPGAVDALLASATDIPVFAADIGMDLPAEVIAERPDVQNAEYQLMQAAALRDIRAADHFPRLTLSGFLGLGSSERFGASTPANLFVQLARPLLDYGRIERQIDVAEAQKQQAFSRYRQSILLAVENVENASVVYQQEKLRLESLQRTADLQREVARQARLRYKIGDATFLDVLIAEQQLLNSEFGAVQSKSRLAGAGVDLYTALGANVPRNL